MKKDNLKICPHCKNTYFREQKGKCPNCKKNPHIFDAGIVNGVRLTYVYGNVFATPVKRNKRNGATT